MNDSSSTEPKGRIPVISLGLRFQGCLGQLNSVLLVLKKALFFSLQEPLGDSRIASYNFRIAIMKIVPCLKILEIPTVH